MINLESVREAIKRQNQDWEAGRTEIAERYETGAMTMFGFAPKGREPSGGRGRLSIQSFAAAAMGPTPRTWDWRSVKGEDWTTAVRDQGTCGSCVGFATCAVLESRLKIKEQDAHLSIANAHLSVAHLFFCGAGRNGCDEGWQIGSALVRCRDRGVGPESAFRYKPKQTACTEIASVVRVPRWRRVRGAADRKEPILLRGPVIAGLVVFSDLLWYKGGVYRPTTTERLGLHAVAIIGYDDDKACWIIKNSWGTAWGEGGFARVGYGCCGVDTEFDFYDPEVELPVGPASKHKGPRGSTT